MAHKNKKSRSYSDVSSGNNCPLQISRICLHNLNMPPKWPIKTKNRDLILTRTCLNNTSQYPRYAAQMVHNDKKSGSYSDVFSGDNCEEQVSRIQLNNLDMPPKCPIRTRNRGLPRVYSRKTIAKNTSQDCFSFQENNFSHTQFDEERR